MEKEVNVGKGLQQDTINVIDQLINLLDDKINTINKKSSNYFFFNINQRIEILISMLFSIASLTIYMLNKGS